jgi:hypothetical protein
MYLESGSRPGPYEIVAPLGAGGTGEVYRALNDRIGRGAAPKRLRGAPRKVTDAGSVALHETTSGACAPTVG